MLKIKRIKAIAGIILQKGPKMRFLKMISVNLLLISLFKDLKGIWLRYKSLKIDEAVYKKNKILNVIHQCLSYGKM